MTSLATRKRRGFPAVTEKESLPDGRVMRDCTYETEEFQTGDIADDVSERTV